MTRDPEFLFIGGRPAVDLALTGDLTPPRAAYERLREPADLVRWFGRGPLHLQGLAADARDLDAAHELRQAVWELVDAHLSGRDLPAAAVRTVNRHAATPDLAPRLIAAGSSAISGATVRAALATIARDAVGLFGDPLALGRLRQCAAEDCRVVFFDDSRPGRRRWCSPQRCGNRLRARTYRARHREDRGGRSTPGDRQTC